jgi:hypothetical protein
MNVFIKLVESLFPPQLKAVGAVVNNESIFKRKKRAPFNPKITSEYHFIQGI